MVRWKYVHDDSLVSDAWYPSHATRNTKESQSSVDKGSSLPIAISKMHTEYIQRSHRASVEAKENGHHFKLVSRKVALGSEVKSFGIARTSYDLQRMGLQMRRFAYLNISKMSNVKFLIEFQNRVIHTNHFFVEFPFLSSSRPLLNTSTSAAVMAFP